MELRITVGSKQSDLNVLYAWLLTLGTSLHPIARSRAPRSITFGFTNRPVHSDPSYAG